ncbi:transcription termination factor 4, mitochondrial isoform X2 [Pteropus alecto]|uniref:transcription termination factor 4, mitochondrial isoform X2 n=1 Tax=Pteropus alecto TaxID=9402 RepID=UPI000D53AE22|nr:transcription termination factor 4, mitochondrial isoform X2 [Pteropus alecto]
MDPPGDFIAVLDWHRLIPLTWARISGPAPPLGPRRMTASLLRRLTTASSGGGLEELPCVEPRKYVQEPECRTNLTQGLLEKQGPPVDGGSLEQEEVIRSLLDMGFSDVHIKELLGVRRGAPPRQLLDVISELVLLGVHPEPVCAVLKKSPQLLKLPVMQVKKRSSYLRKLGLGEGRLKRVLLCCPEVLTMRQRDLDGTVRVLRDKCLFTAQQVTEILHRCPFVLREDPGELEYKFQVTSRQHIRMISLLEEDGLGRPRTRPPLGTAPAPPPHPALRWEEAWGAAALLGAWLSELQTSPSWASETHEVDGA